ncbi:MAG: hypothetical protein JO316_00885 [Abitibacteriaceae bacterium]|nr:hypothetical protein [Abditibacteriaceae bacterium]MBV9863883.1 hypothetical protein [Abditibacteriaceae bacterium]
MSGSSIGLLSFLSFSFSIIAAVLAIDMYRLLRTGEYGKTWRLLIITSVMFALLQALRLAEFFNITALDINRLSQIVELVFVMSLAYTFYLQRRVFTFTAKLRQKEDDNALVSDAPEAPDPTARETEWNRLAGNYAGYYEDHKVLAQGELQADDDIEWDSRPTSTRHLPPSLPSTTPKPQP